MPKIHHITVVKNEIAMNLIEICYICSSFFEMRLIRALSLDFLTSGKIANFLLNGQKSKVMMFALIAWTLLSVYRTIQVFGDAFRCR